MAEPKQFGLILRKPTAVTGRVPHPSRKITAASTNVLGDEDSSDDSDDAAAKSQAARLRKVDYTSKLAMESAQTKMLHEEAMAEDPNIFDYDAAYEQLQERKLDELRAKKEADKERKPKYMDKLMKSARQRELEFVVREERKQHKERVTEGEKYADKEEFITSTYKKQMEELSDYRAEQEYQDRVEAAMDVQKQGGMSGFYRNLLDTLTSDNRNAVQTKPKVKLEIPPNPDMKSKEEVDPSGADTAMRAEPHKPRHKYEKPDKFEDEKETRSPSPPRKEHTQFGLIKRAQPTVDTGRKQNLRRRDDHKDESSEDDEKSKHRRADHKGSRSAESSDSAASFTGKEIVSEPHTKRSRRGRRPSPMRRSQSPRAVVRQRTSDNSDAVRPHKDRDHKKSPSRHKTSPRHHRDVDEHRRGRGSTERHDRTKDDTRTQPPPPAKQVAVTKVDDDEEDVHLRRMLMLRKMLSRRNTEEDIDEMRRRYFERQAAGEPDLPV